MVGVLHGLLQRDAGILINLCMYLRKYNLNHTELSEQCFSVSGIYLHKAFQSPTVASFEFDIAVVRLDREVTPSNEISFVCFPPSRKC